MMRMGSLLRPTMVGENNIFHIKVSWRGRKLDLIMWDVPGEVYSMRELREKYSIEFLLQHCRSVMVAILCKSPFDHDENPATRAYQEDETLANLFHQTFKSDTSLRKVVILLIGVDVFSHIPEEANAKAIEAFYSQYRIFPGTLKNTGISFEFVPLSNIGLQNKIERELIETEKVDSAFISSGFPLDDGFDEEIEKTTPSAHYTNYRYRIALPPNPYNVLEPLRRIFPIYLPWWSRWLLYLTKLFRNTTDKNTESLATGKRENSLPEKSIGSIFISYRREGGAETARLIRNELLARGWKVFLDVEDLGACSFDQSLWLEINKADNFLLILSPRCLAKCANRQDWFRREIIHAHRTAKNIVPILKDGFEFPSDGSLDPDLEFLRTRNGIVYSHHFFNATVDKAVSFLKKKTLQ